MPWIQTNAGAMFWLRYRNEAHDKRSVTDPTEPGNLDFAQQSLLQAFVGPLKSKTFSSRSLRFRFKCQQDDTL